jgi:DNA repair exonuclease SbcCD nuclease subunit
MTAAPTDHEDAPDGHDLPDGVQLAHVSDTHVGYEAYRRVAASGENQRGVDILRAFLRAGRDIADWDPPLVIHSGDVAERPHIPIRHMLGVRQWLAELAAIRPDGSRRQVVVIAGNHDLPAQRREACFLELYRDLPGVHIVTDGPACITFTDAGTPGGPSGDLARVRLWAVPHDSLKDLGRDGGFADITPAEGWLNLLVAHGVAGGSDLYRRVQGREYTIPTDLLGRAWDYVALGHWHRPGPIGVSGKRVTGGRVWYAGSTENMGFGDVIDNDDVRGWNAVTLHPGDLPTVERRPIPIRTMYRLGVVDGAGATPADIEAALLGRVQAAAQRGQLADAVVGQRVRNVPREVWSLVDLTAVRAAAEPALHWEVTVEPVRSSDTDGDAPAAPGQREIGVVVDAVVADTCADHPEDRRDAVATLVHQLLAAELGNVADDPGDPGDASGASDAGEDDVSDGASGDRTEVPA